LSSCDTSRTEECRNAYIQYMHVRRRSAWFVMKEPDRKGSRDTFMKWDNDTVDLDNFVNKIMGIMRAISRAYT
jgi:hypothetical protein